jgi:hypothetical protein
MRHAGNRRRGSERRQWINVPEGGSGWKVRMGQN